MVLRYYEDGEVLVEGGIMFDWGGVPISGGEYSFLV